MTLTELVNGVYAVTNRPDLVALTEQFVKQATLKLHQLDFFYKDLFETGMIFGSPEIVQQVDIKSLIPRWRANKYLRKSDASGSLGNFIEDIKVPENSLDSYNIIRDDVYYVAGDLLNIRSSTALQYVLYGCFRYPDITTLSFSSFIAIDHPYAIINDAATSIFKRVGKDSEAALMRTLVWGDGKNDKGLAGDIIMSNTATTGY